MAWTMTTAMWQNKDPVTGQAHIGKKLKVRGSPWHFSETLPKIGIASEVVEHNAPILKSLGYSDAQIKELKDKEVI